jgi:multiple sugar transport system permease protein
MRSSKKKNAFSLKQAAGVTMMLGFLFFTLLPIIWALILALRPENRLFEPIWESPTDLTLDNIGKIAKSGFPHALLNSFVTASVSTLLAVVIGVPGGFALAKGR